MTNKRFATAFIGTYTKSESKGIYSFQLDQNTGKIEHLKFAAEVDNPTYLAVSSDKRNLYSVAKEGSLGGIAAFIINPETYELTKVNSKVTAGSPPCHISVNKEKLHILTSNYHMGTVEAFSVASDGGVNDVISIVEHSGSGPDPRQEKAHTHYAAFTPDEKYVVVVELGIDQVITYKLTRDEELRKVSNLNVKSGSGPRHLVFHPDGMHAYVMTEFSSEVILLQFNQESGSFVELQYIKTIPDDFTENNQGSAIHISADGKFVYAGNRGHNSIAVFAVDELTKELRFIERVSTEGDWPRDFAIEPSGRFIVAANQNSNNLTTYSRDPETGRLTLLEKNIPAPEPVCIKFLNEN